MDVLARRMHPHHHGSGSLQTQSASVPLVVDQNPATGFDFLATPSCEGFRSLFAPENEVIMHMQVRSLPISRPSNPSASLTPKSHVPEVQIISECVLWQGQIGIPILQGMPDW